MDKIVECPNCKGMGCACGCHDPEPIFESEDKLTHSQFNLNNISDKEFEDLLDELDSE